jgi:hypothetical protein
MLGIEEPPPVGALSYFGLQLGPRGPTPHRTADGKKEARKDWIWWTVVVHRAVYFRSEGSRIARQSAVLSLCCLRHFGLASIFSSGATLSVLCMAPVRSVALTVKKNLACISYQSTLHFEHHHGSRKGSRLGLSVRHGGYGSTDDARHLSPTRSVGSDCVF